MLFLAFADSETIPDDRGFRVAWGSRGSDGPHDRTRAPETLFRRLMAVYTDYAKMVLGNQKEPWQSSRAPSSKPLLPASRPRRKA
jgi:hypothetical protein